MVPVLPAWEWMCGLLHSSGCQKRQIFFFFLNFWLCWVFIAVHGLSLDVVSASLQCLAFSRWWILLSQSAGLECAGLSSCGPWAQLPPNTETSDSLLLLLLFLIKIDLPT